MIGDEWTTGSAALVAWIVLTSGVVHLVERRSQLRYSFVRAGLILAGTGVAWAGLAWAGVLA